MRSKKDYAFLTLKGMAMGAADVIPGVSGGTIAFITGIYEELLATISSVNISALKKLKSIPEKRFRLEIVDALEYLKRQPDNSFDAVISVWVLHNFLDDFRLDHDRWSCLLESVITCRLLTKPIRSSLATFATAPRKKLRIFPERTH